ncbi:hypothetical protein GLOIN_2v1839456 [Rhizophagus irregularis DAOM 181602=DAOM 197198]|uniref:HCP-like protein n=1 Tax=Rhizophagus irregularis (strain DAOM 181602 / DAOM 197198 / MUCL 43194) TaxID=747089 RepID=A0A2P4Q975_RHIID|nr:hypothetical protein GLOIN_2v1839456 [Rhizophagus irregularis DAOM 181602=DAOM 197198]POG74177.1 hypothetical protein GLOIN_2v1839456 [Rhizophagus irregularis DAOM 181602=DAOM 197198]|eukprot:XP_025181043.1 hypothetical protein GLOIN_2v1839456 [Rhizophagus irregularis DAOM 181602=DAOM 197198]
MSDNYNDNIFILESNIEEYEPSSFKFNVTKSSCNNFMTDFFKELLQELYVILLNIDIKSDIEVQLNEFMNNFLFEYDLDPKDVLDIMTNNSENIFCYSKKGHAPSQFTIANYYKCVPKDLEKWYYWNRKAAINGCIDAQYKLADYYLNNNNEGKAFKWYMKLADKKDSIRALYLVAKCYRDGIGIDKNFKEATNWFNKLKQEYVTHCDKTITNIHPSAEFHGYIERGKYCLLSRTVIIIIKKKLGICYEYGYGAINDEICRAKKVSEIDEYDEFIIFI